MRPKHEYDIAQLTGQIRDRREHRIRDTRIRVHDVYRSLKWQGLTNEAAIAKYPGLTAEDLAYVRDFVHAEIRARDHDEITGRAILQKNRLVSGRYYKGRCRNATVARWNAAENRFYHWREKFRRIFIETIRYPTDEDEPWWDVFDVVEELTAPKFEIPFEQNAVFQGNPADLKEFDEEMWSGWKRTIAKRT